MKKKDPRDSDLNPILKRSLQLNDEKIDLKSSKYEFIVKNRVCKFRAGNSFNETIATKTIYALIYIP